MHVRMQSQENVEISNPMYMREEADEDAETMVPTFVMAGDKVIHYSYDNDGNCSYLSLSYLD